ncbi:Fanconi-associated nuclease 1 [Wickerhamiella sorbophila]|uniref:Fanconi-associated nuclease n=1 Tax=Wickerhamiella sorbophila TaxID=45607 RepID=A0A2T0FJ60_9ASCO|nr:Fanconi-associated nuclease 1 [Wickerhamiella sorbophila]PRT54987.1 Fanconi-associated nuclease 1 [Wickerhamiella sorbophila]
MSERKYWEITENDVYVQVFREMLEELDLTFFKKDIIDSYKSLSLQGQYVVTRLYYRSAKWLRQSDLEKYLPPDELKGVLEELVQKNWLLSEPDLDIYLEVATVKELQAVAVEFNIKKAMSRPQLVAALEELCKRKTFFGPPLRPKVTLKLKGAVSSLYLLNEGMSSTLALVSFMFLVPAQITLDVVVRTNMKMIKFRQYDYLTQKEAPIFESKHDFIDYYEARVLCDPLEESASSCTQELIEVVRLKIKSTSPRNGPFSAAYVYGRALALVSECLGKAGKFQEEYQMIQEYFEQEIHKSRKSSLIIRKLNLELRFFKELQDTSWLLKAINTYYDASGIVNSIYAFDLSRKAVRMSREIEKVGLSVPPLELSKFEQLPTNLLEAEQLELLPGQGVRTRWGQEGASNTVEETALIHYADYGWAGGHYEGGMISTLFWLAFHDIIFSDKTQFRCRFHNRPLKLQSVLDTNKTKIEKRVTDNLKETIINSFKTLYELQPNVGGINWNIPLEGIEAVIDGLGNALGAILLRLAESYYTYNSGFPDLTLWKTEEPECKFVEVKSTNDTISDNQYVWIQFLSGLGIPVEICKIRGKRKRE